MKLQGHTSVVSAGHILLFRKQLQEISHQRTIQQWTTHMKMNKMAHRKYGTRTWLDFVRAEMPIHIGQVPGQCPQACFPSGSSKLLLSGRVWPCGALCTCNQSPARPVYVKKGQRRTWPRHRISSAFLLRIPLVIREDARVWVSSLTLSERNNLGYGSSPLFWFDLPNKHSNSAGEKHALATSSRWSIFGLFLATCLRNTSHLTAYKPTSVFQS